MKFTNIKQLIIKFMGGALENKIGDIDIWYNTTYVAID